MKNITITRTKNTVNAPYLPYAAYKSALALADMLDGKIGTTSEGFFKADFPTVTKAKAFVEAWTRSYEDARNERNAQKPKASKPTATKGKTKGNAFDYSVIKGESKKDKNRALHAMLVSMGIKDSRTAEYQAVWNARPWAK